MILAENLIEATTNSTQMVELLRLDDLDIPPGTEFSLNAEAYSDGEAEYRYI